jgi:hypothetical protein
MITHIATANRRALCSRDRCGKDISDHEPVDRPTWGGRLQRSLELLGKARADTSEEEDNPSSKVHGLQVYALEHIANAEKFVKEGMDDARSLKESPPPRPGQSPGVSPRAQRSTHGARAPRVAGQGRRGQVGREARGRPDRRRDQGDPRGRDRRRQAAQRPSADRRQDPSPRSDQVRRRSAREVRPGYRGARGQYLRQGHARPRRRPHPRGDPLHPRSSRRPQALATKAGQSMPSWIDAGGPHQSMFMGTASRIRCAASGTSTARNAARRSCDRTFRPVRHAQGQLLVRFPPKDPQAWGHGGSTPTEI